MKSKILIISIILALTALLQFGDNRYYTSGSDYNTSGYETACEICTLTSPDSELNLPRPTGITNIPRCQSTAKRSTNSGTSVLYAFTKSGKILTVQSKDLSQICPNLIFFGQISVSEYLICLRRLLI